MGWRSDLAHKYVEEQKKKPLMLRKYEEYEKWWNNIAEGINDPPEFMLYKEWLEWYEDNMDEGE